jgi:hypothetical protein
VLRQHPESRPHESKRAEQHQQHLSSAATEHDGKFHLTTQAQRPGPRGRAIATRARWPGSLQRLVRPLRTVKMESHPNRSPFQGLDVGA